MNKNKIINLFSYCNINYKTNNYLFTKIDDFNFLENIDDFCTINMPEEDIDLNKAYNIKIDLSQIKVNDILTYILNYLGIHETLNFNDKFALFKFRNILNNYGIVIQLIFYNIEHLDLANQMLFNELFFFNSLYFNINVFTKNDNLLTYLLSNNQVLDDRENYTKLEYQKDYIRLRKSL